LFHEDCVNKKGLRSDSQTFRFESDFFFLNLYFQSLTTHLSPHRINRRRGKGRADYGKKKKEENFHNQKKEQTVAQFFQE
jgi:hypothetical protein